MHRLLHIVLVVYHRLVNGVQLALWHYGPAVLAKYTMPCAWLILALCVLAAGLELPRRRWFVALLWIAMGCIVYTGFWLANGLADARWTGGAGRGALLLDLVLLAVSLLQAIRGTERPSSRAECQATRPESQAARPESQATRSRLR